MMSKSKIERIVAENKEEFRKFQYQNGSSRYLIEEDIVGWYLIIYSNRENHPRTSYLTCLKMHL